MGGFLFLLLFRDEVDEEDELEMEKVWMGVRNMADW